MQFQNQQLTDDMNFIMDVFAGADGGVDYIKVRMALLAFEQKYIEGDDASEHILQIVQTFANLLRVIIKMEG